MLQAQGITDDDCGRLRQAFGEALANALYHGSRRNGVPLGCDADGSRIFDPTLLDPEKQIHVCVRLEELFAQNAEAPNARVQIEMEDEGPGFDPTTVPDASEASNREKPEGRGLLLMRYFSSHVEHQNGGRCVILSRKPRRRVDIVPAAQEAPLMPEAPASPREPRG